MVFHVSKYGKMRSIFQLPAWFLILGIVALWLLGTCGVALAQGPEPQIVPELPRAPASPLSPQSSPPTASPFAQSLPPLKAVLIVGPIDGDTGNWTTSEKKNMDLAASELAANGVAVQKFYAPNNDWAQIKAAANGAHFLLYRGHGVYWPPPGMPHPPVGGFNLSGNSMPISNQKIRDELKLAPNAIVMLYACFSAGSAANDTGDIGLAEAQRRVGEYSHPFLDTGVAGYYADWFGDAFQLWVRYLFAGQTLGQAYKSFYDFNASTVNYGVHPDPQHTDKAMWLDKDNWTYVKYNNAFVGLLGETLATLFNPVSCLATPSSPKQFYYRNVSVPAGAGWTASFTAGAGSWVTANPLSGTGGGDITVQIKPSGLSVGKYQTGLKIVVTAPDGSKTEQTFAISLYVVQHLHPVYLPINGH
jgi:hypothetical protein